MSSIRDQILTAIVGALNAPGKPGEITVRRFAVSKIEPEQAPVIQVYPGKDPVQEPATKTQPVLKRTLSVILDVYAVTEPLDQSLDPCLCWITEGLNADRSLGGLALDLREKNAEWDADMAATGWGVCKVIVEIDYMHNRNNQEIKP